MDVLSLRVLICLFKERINFKTQNLRDKSKWWRLFRISRGKKSVRKRVWYIGGKYKRALKRKKQMGDAIPFGLIASLTGPILGEVAKLIFKKILGRGRRRQVKKW